MIFQIKSVLRIKNLVLVHFSIQSVMYGTRIFISHIYRNAPKHFVSIEICKSLNFVLIKFDERNMRRREFIYSFMIVLFERDLTEPNCYAYPIPSH